MRIRLAEPGDLPRLSRLVEESNAEMAGLYGEHLSDLLVIGMFRHGIVAGDAVVVAECEDGELVGFTGYVVMPGLPLGHAASLGIYVKPEHRRDHLGLALREFAIEQAEMRGVKKLRAEVRLGNEAGLALAERTAFRVVGHIIERDL